MKRYSIQFSSILLMILFAGTAHAQLLRGNSQRTPGLPYFETRVFPTFTSDSGELIARVYVQFANDYLTFVKSDSGFTASIQVEIYFSDDAKEYKFSRTLGKDVTAREYAETNASSIRHSIYTDIPVEPGIYIADVTLLDKNNNRHISQKRRFQVLDDTLEEDHSHRRPYVMSDVMFLDVVNYDDAGNISSYQPMLSNLVGTNKEYLYAYFNTFSYDPDDSLTFLYKVFDEEGKVVQQNQYISKPDSGFMEHFIRLNRYNFEKNTYTFELASTTDGNDWLRARQSFSFTWKDAPHTLQDLDLAIAQLEYIAEKDSVNKYKEASFDRKKEFFQRFWQERDPNPATIENELQSEYYRRVSLAIHNFSVTGDKGWRTDRGRIFIKFGEPDDYERHPFEAQGYPYEIWRYYQLRKTFYFIDRTGFGDYVLHPNYYFVEYE